MTRSRRSLPFSVLVSGLVFANACGRTALDAPLPRGAQSTGGTNSGLIGTGGNSGGTSQSSTSNAGGTIAGSTGGSAGGSSQSSAGSSGGAIAGNASGGVGGTSQSSTNSMGGTTAGGSGGSPGGVCDEIPCLAPSVRDCAPSGGCTSQGMVGPTPLSTTSNYCYANGVKTQTVATVTGPSPITSTVTFKHDNQTCFSVDTATMDGSTYTLVFRDSSGKQIATGGVGGGGLWILCDGSSTPALISDACSNAAYLVASGSASCNPGLCTF